MAEKNQIDEMHQEKIFPQKQVLFYLASQIFVGFILLVIPFDRFQSLSDLLKSIDDYSRTYRTMFMYSSEPTAGKMYLIIWWALMIPWGVLWTFSFTNGFKPVHKFLEVGIFVIARRLALGLVVFIGMVYMNFFANYEKTSQRTSEIISRSDLIPLLVSSGTLTLSIWLALCSFVMIVALVLVCASIRGIFQIAFDKKD